VTPFGRIAFMVVRGVKGIRVSSVSRVSGISRDQEHHGMIRRRRGFLNAVICVRLVDRDSDCRRSSSVDNSIEHSRQITQHT
jgi:hypothetical protein